MINLKNVHLIFFVCYLGLFPNPANAQNIDIDLLKSINPQPPHTGFWTTISDTHIMVAGAASLGNLAYALIKQDKNLQHKSYETLMAIGINLIATGGMKVVFNRTRPADKYPNEVFVLTISDGKSFPSGHTSLAFATATALSVNYKKWFVVVPAYLWAGSVGYSRMYLGKHYPSDVLAGAIVGAGSSVASHWLNKKLFYQKVTNEVKPAMGF